MSSPAEYDPWGDLATARRMRATAAPKHLRNAMTAIACFAHEADIEASWLRRVGARLGSAALLARAAELEREALKADYLLMYTDDLAAPAGG